jgi:hypothetical protein
MAAEALRGAAGSHGAPYGYRVCGSKCLRTAVCRGAFGSYEAALAAWLAESSRMHAWKVNTLC